MGIDGTVHTPEWSFRGAVILTTGWSQKGVLLSKIGCGPGLPQGKFSALNSGGRFN